MSIIGNRYLQGNPTLPYTDVKAYEGDDVFFDGVEFLDHTQTPVVPTALQLEIDDITNDVVMFGPATLNSGGSTTSPLFYPTFAASWYMQASATVMNMTYPYQGSQLCQFKFRFTAVDSVTGQPFSATAVAIVELCSAATVTGTF